MYLGNHTLPSDSEATLFNFSDPNPKIWPGFSVVSGDAAHFIRDAAERIYIANFGNARGASVLTTLALTTRTSTSMPGRALCGYDVETYNTSVVPTRQQEEAISVADQATSPYTLPPVRLTNESRDARLLSTWTSMP